MLHPPERRLQLLLAGHAILSAVLACLYLASGDTGVLGALPNSFAKDALFVALSALGAADVRRRGWFALLLALAYLALVAGQVATLLWGGAPDVDVLGLHVSATVALLAWMAVDLVLAAWLAAWWVAAARARDGLRYLHPAGFAALQALADVTIEGDRELLSPADVARNVDGYLADLDARAKGKVQLALLAVAAWPLLTLRPPLPALDHAARRAFLERRFIDPAARRRLPRPLRPLLQAAVRTAAQMSYLGYYGDRRTWASIGYTPYLRRPGATPAPAPVPPRLATLPQPPSARHDVIVVGSGAAGSILAARLAAAGRRVLVLERGPHVDPAAFTDDEVQQYLELYNEGALQLATNFSLQVLQGMCVGGGTTINNGLCLDPPAAVLDDWAAAGIDPGGLRAAIADVRADLGIQPIRADRTSPAARRFAAAVPRMDLPGRVELMEANITDACRGTGYCNIGCGFAARHAALDVLLPRAQQAGDLDVLADFAVERIERRGRRATGVTGRHRGGPRVTLAAETIVVAAGPIGSSGLLLRSGIGGDAVGRGLHFNINSPLTAEFEDEVDAFAGIQMSHAYVPPGDPPPYLVETWFNPPATQALAMPGWFGRHWAQMHRFRRMACAGVIAGTTVPGRVTESRGGPEIHYDPAPEDRDRVLEGLEVAGRIWLAAGATRVMPATFGFREYAGEAALARLPADIRGSADLLLTSAHPQGGNAIGTVVGADFRVDGTENLYLCDASAFPTSVHVNPQLTVMGLAEYAARSLLERPAPRIGRAAPDHAPTAPA